jgi:hypothetical protein
MAIQELQANRGISKGARRVRRRGPRKPVDESHYGVGAPISTLAR